MDKDTTKTKNLEYPVLLEELLGRSEYESFLGKVQEGKLKDADAMAKYLKKAVAKRYGSLLSEERLDSHDRKIIAKIEQLLGVEKELGKEKAAHKEAKKQLGNVQKQVNFLEPIIIEIARAVGYTAEPAYTTGKKQALQQEYINGLLIYIQDGSSVSQIGESNKLLLGQAKECKKLSERIALLENENASLRKNYVEMFSAIEPKEVVDFKKESEELNMLSDKIKKAIEKRNKAMQDAEKKYSELKAKYEQLSVEGNSLEPLAAIASIIGYSEPAYITAAKGNRPNKEYVPGLIAALGNLYKEYKQLEKENDTAKKVLADLTKSAKKHLNAENE